MEGRVHGLAGLGAAATAWLYIPQIDINAAVIPITIYAGSMLPDRLELRIIRHRTWTHWLLGWLVIILAAWMSPIYDTLAIFIGGCVAGVAVHVIGDALTPMGVPVWTPYRRVSLVRSNRHRARNAIGYVAAFWLPVLAWWATN